MNKKATIAFVFVIFGLILVGQRVYAADTYPYKTYFKNYSASQLLRKKVCSNDARVDTNGDGIVDNYGKDHRVLCDGLFNDGRTSLTKADLISKIESLLNSTLTNDVSIASKIGASFIVHTMIGKTQPDGSPVVTPAEIVDWKNRVNNPAVYIFSENYTYTLNSTLVVGPGGVVDSDVRFYGVDKATDSAWVFKDSTGKILYAIKKKCANPIGDLPKGVPTPPPPVILPPYTPPPVVDWEFVTSSSVQGGIKEAAPGDTITWDHKLTKSGTTAINTNVSYQYQNYGDFPANTAGGQGVLASGWNGTTKEFSSIYPLTGGLTQDDVGKRFCRATTVYPGKWSDPNLWVISPADGACVSVPYNWYVTTSSSVGITTAKPGETITWNHKVTHNGPTLTNKKITYQYQDYGSFPDGKGGVGILDLGWAKGSIKTFDSTYNVTQTYVGKSVCRATTAYPISSGSDAWYISPAGGACVSVPYNFSLAPTTKISIDTATPGSSIEFSHTLINNAPTVTNGDVNYNINVVMVESATAPNQTQVLNGAKLATKNGTVVSANTGNNDGTQRALDLGANKTIKYKIDPEDVSKWICSYISASPWSNADSSAVTSYICKYIVYNYGLTPNLSTTQSGVVESGASVGLKPIVQNSGPTKSKPSQWQLTKIVVPSGDTVANSAGGDSIGNPCIYFNKSGAICSSLVSVNNSVFIVGTNTLLASSDDFSDYEVGTRLCYSLSVNPLSSISDNWRHSAPVCLVVGKKPKVQVLGGNLKTGGKVQTSQSLKSGNLFGSWDEYGIFSGGTIVGMASGSAFAAKAGLLNASACGYSKLIFTSAGEGICSSTTVIGNYTNSKSIPDFAASFYGGTAIAAGTAIVANNQASGTYTVAGDLTLNASSLDLGKSVIIKATGTVRIIGNQSYYGGPYANSSQLPQLVIMANKIIINSGVTNIDAWLIANGTDGIIETCDTGSTTYVLALVNSLTVDKCNQPLVVNGPVMAKQLWLRRTAGSGIGDLSGDPAEVFNLRPDAYLWSAARTVSTGRIKAVYSTELPPRF